MVTLTPFEWDVVKWVLGFIGLLGGGVISGITSARLTAWRQATKEAEAKAERDKNAVAHTTLDVKIEKVRKDVWCEIGRVGDGLTKRVSGVEEMAVRAHRRIEAHDVDLMALKTSSANIEKRMDEGFERVDAGFRQVDGRFAQVNDSIVGLTEAVLDRKGA